MSLFVLDTDILTLYQLGHAAVGRRVLQCPPTELAVSIITVEEQLSGWYTLLRRNRGAAKLAVIYERMTANVTFLSRLQILSFTEQAILRFESLQRMKLGVRATDLRIAAIVLEANAVLVTRNRADFGRVPHLAMEDWSL